jgi:hypothetical protein
VRLSLTLVATGAWRLKTFTFGNGVISRTQQGRRECLRGLQIT